MIEQYLDLKKEITMTDKTRPNEAFDQTIPEPLVTSYAEIQGGPDDRAVFDALAKDIRSGRYCKSAAILDFDGLCVQRGSDGLG